jgi:hypothetical protein
MVELDDESIRSIILTIVPVIDDLSLLLFNTCQLPSPSHCAHSSTYAEYYPPPSQERCEHFVLGKVMLATQTHHQHHAHLSECKPQQLGRGDLWRGGATFGGGREWRRNRMGWPKFDTGLFGMSTHADRI